MLDGLVIVASAYAQEGPELTWDPIVEVRQRASASANGDDGTGEVGQRARVGIEAERGAAEALVSIQDVRRWAASSGGIVYPTGFSPEIAEAWARVQGDLSRNIGARVTVGRQALTVHEGRILGDDDFRLEGQFFDALRIEAHARPFEFEYINARHFVAGEDPFGLGVNVLRAGAHGDVGLTHWVTDALWVVDARRTDARSSTQGLYLKLDTGRWRTRAEGYLQGTTAGTGGFVGLSAGRVFGRNEHWIVYLRYDGASADASPLGLVAWQPVLGDTHRFEGLLDRFHDPEDSDDRGLLDAQLSVEAHPIARIDAALTFHHFRSPRDGGAFGTEADLTGAWWFAPVGRVAAGGAWFASDPAFDAADRRYGYLEMDVRF